MNADAANAPLETQRGGDAFRIGRLSLALLFLLALVLRIGTAIDYARYHPHATDPAIDEEAYEKWARDLAAGDWMGDAVFFQEPLYPYWLGTIHALWNVGQDEEMELYRGRTATRHIQSFYGSFACVLLALLTARMFGRRAGIIAGVAFATYPPLYFFPALFLKPNLVVPLVCLLPWLMVWIRARETPARWGVLGVAAGLGALLRGNLLLFLPVFALLPVLYAWLSGRRPASAIRFVGAVLLGVALVLLPVAARNHAVGGVFALTTSGAGTNLYGGNNAENPYGLATEFSWVRGVPEHEADDWRHEAERRTGRMMDPGEVSSYWLKQTLSSMRDDPAMHARILWNKLRLTLGAYEVPDNHHLAWDARFVSALRVPLGGFGVWGMLGLAGMGVFLLRRRLRMNESGEDSVGDGRAAGELIGFFLLYLATIVLTVTSMRIRLALVPALLPFAGYLIDVILRRARPIAWAPALACAALIVHWPALPAAKRADDLLERDSNHAIQLLQADRLDEADEIAVRLEEARPGTIQVALLRAEIAYRRGARALVAGAPGDEVEAEFDRALALLRPVATGAGTPPRDRFRAQKLAGLVQFEVRAWDVAERRFREALAFDPSDVDVRLRLADILWMRAATAEGDARIEALTEARALVAGVLAEHADEALESTLERIDSALAE